jgi:hypothetical protein
VPKLDPNSYLPVEEYKEAFDALNGITGMMLFEFAKHGEADRDTIIRNFIARTNIMVKAIVLLWELKDYHDCWILHRCLLDRYFHLEELYENNSFEKFEAWSFLQQYDAINGVRSDQEFNGGPNDTVFALSDEQKERAKKLRAQLPEWRRPRAEDVAKRLRLPFLYRYGYDYGSTHVHPMANDGFQDFYTITGLQPAPAFPDWRVVLSNTLLVSTMLVQTGMNASSLHWRKIVYVLLEELREFLDKGRDAYKLTYVKLSRAIGQGLSLAEPADDGAA